MNGRHLPRFFAIFAAALLFGCGESAPPTAPLAPELEARQPQPSLLSDPELLVCPTPETHSTSATIGLFGGSLTVDGHRLTIPFGAVLLPTTFTMTVPAGDEVKVRIRAGSADHYLFLLPVKLRLSYARCDPAAVPSTPLQVVYVSESNLVLELLGGVQNLVTQSVTTTTTHLSDYAIGAN